MKSELKFEYDTEDYQDKLEIKRIMKSQEVFTALHEVGEKIFRPARKHGYSDEKLRDLLNKSEHGNEIISLLEEKYHDILRESEILDLI